MNIILDTNIWIASTETYIRNNTKNDALDIHLQCSYLIKSFYHKCRDFLIFDYEGDVIKEIFNNIGKNSPSAKILQLFITRNKISKVARGGISIKERLDKIGFDKSDLKFLEMHMKLPSKTIIISFDSDFKKLNEQLHHDKTLQEFLRFPIIMTPSEANKTYFN